MRSNYFSLSFIFILLSLSSGFVQAQECPSCGVSNASRSLSLATSTVVNGSMMAAGASGNLLVESVSTVSNGIIIVLNGSAEAVSVTVKLSGEGLHQLGIVSGMVLQASAVSTGHLLISAGKVIAFIPNELGKALIHHEQIK